MNTLTSQALKLIVAISMTEREAMTEKLTAVIEKYRDNPEKSEELANTIIQFLTNLTTEVPGSLAASANVPATKEDIGLLLLEIQHLKREIADLKQAQDR